MDIVVRALDALYSFLVYLYRFTGIYLALLCLAIFADYKGNIPIPQTEVFLALGIAALISAARWRLIEERLGANLSQACLSVPIRYFLAYIAALYGFAKLIPGQFSLPLCLLDSPLGLARGFYLTWRFFEYAPAYANFIGVSQVIGSLLLLSRRTTTLGAMLLATVFVNIVIINFAYDIPVKLYSTTFLLMAIYLILPDLPRLSALFLENRAFGPRIFPDYWSSSQAKWTIQTAKIVTIALLYLSTIGVCLEMREHSPTASVLYGAWQIDTGQKTYFEKGNWGSFREQDGSLSIFDVDLDESRKTVHIAFHRSRHPDITASYTLIRPNRMRLQGTMGDKPIDWTLTRFRVDIRER